MNEKSEIYLQHRALNTQILRCIMSGQSEIQEADAIRDLMDDTWKKMTHEKQREFRRETEGIE